MSSSPLEQTLPTPEDLRLITLLKRIYGEARDSVVERVLTHRSQLPEDVRGQLAAVINREVRVHGFPNFPERALPAVLKLAILSELEKSDPLTSAILGAWFALHSSLRDVVAKHLGDRGIDTVCPDFGEQMLRDYWSDDDWGLERNLILQSNADLDKDDVALMMCCVTGMMPSRNVKSSGEKTHTMELAILHQTLTYLETLPADSHEWEHVPRFVSSVTEIAAAKVAEREALASREAIETEISEFLREYAVQLEYLQLDVSRWTVPTDCDQSVLLDARGLLSQLKCLNDEYDSIPYQGSTHVETTRLFNERNTVMDRIRSIKAELDKILNAGDDPDDTPSQPDVGEHRSDEGPAETESSELGPAALVQSETPELSTDATLCGLLLSDQVLDFDPAMFDYSVILENSTDMVTITPVPNHSGTMIGVIFESQDGDVVRPLESAGGAYTVGNIPVGQTRILVNAAAEDRETTRIYSLAVTRAPSSDATLSTLEWSIGEVEFSPDQTEYSIRLAEAEDGLSLAFKTAHNDATVEAYLRRPDGVTIDMIESADGRCGVHGLPEGRSVLSVRVTAGDGVTTLTYTVELNCPGTQTTDHAELMWSLIAQDDLAGAYWISKSLAALGQAPPSLPFLLKAVQGARWLSPDSVLFIEDLFMTVSETSPPFDDDSLAMLALAAAFQPSIIAPETNLLAWLTTPECLPSLEVIVSPIRDFANRGYALRPEHIRGDEGQRRLDDLIVTASSAALRWLEDAEGRRQGFKRATDVLRHLCADGGMLNELLRPVVDDRRGEVVSVQSDVEALKQDSYRTEVIAEADRRVLGSSPRNEITGAARAWLHRAILEACEVAARWCDLARRDNETKEQAQNQWMSGQVSELRTQIESVSVRVFTDLSDIASDSSPSDVSASALCLARSIHLMLEYLSVEQDSDLQPRPPSIVADLQTIVHNSEYRSSDTGTIDRLEVGLSKRLLWIPAVDLADDGRPMNPQTPVNLSQADEHWFSADTRIDAAIRARVEINDFRFLDQLEPAWSTSRSDDMVSFYAADLAVARETLGEHLSSAREDVDQAANDGVIEYEGAIWNEFAHAIDDIVIDEVLNFMEAHDILETIRTSVAAERRKRREELLRDWEDLNQDSLVDTDREMEFIKLLTDTFELASQEESIDIRVMEDCVSRLRNYRSGDQQNLGLTRMDGSRATLEDFLSFCGGLRDRRAHLSDGRLRSIGRRSRDEV